MKLTPTPIEIEQYEGFTPEKDIFRRSAFAEELSKLVITNSDELVIALNAPWGEGKTTFVKMWRGMLREKQIESIYFDAYSNDFLEDPFLALVGEVYSLLGQDDDKKFQLEFKKKAVSAIKTFGRVGVRIGVRAATAGLLDGTVIEGAGAENELSDLADSQFSRLLESIEQDKQNLQEFRKVLRKAANDIGNGEKIIFIIDELDRCRPTFALDILEKIKHILSTKEIVFVLVVNREQIGEIIKSRYGRGVDPSRYLQKFIHLWVDLPKQRDQTRSDSVIYLHNCLNRMDFEVETSSQQYSIRVLEDMIKYYNLSLREVERCLSCYAIIHNLTKGELNSEYILISIYLCIVKCRYPETYKKLADGRASFEPVFEETELHYLKEEYWEEGRPENHHLCWLLRYHLADAEEAAKLLEKGDFRDARGHRGAPIVEICRWLETFKQNN